MEDLATDAAAASAEADEALAVATATATAAAAAPEECVPVTVKEPMVALQTT